MEAHRPTESTCPLCRGSCFLALHKFFCLLPDLCVFQEKPEMRVLMEDLQIFLFSFYLFLAALGLRCCARAFSSCGERGLFFVVVRGLLIAVASLIVEHRL